MPGDIDVALRIGGNRTSAIETVCVSDDVAFGLEGSAGVGEAGVEKRDGRSPTAHTIPGDVNTAIVSNRELSAANRADGHGGVWLSVNRDRFGKFVRSRLAADIKNIPGFWVTFEVNQVEDAL